MAALSISAPVPAGRTDHAAVWTGDRMLVWGGYTGFGETNNGSAYDPITDTWNSLTNSSAPAKRANHSGVWTGQEMVIWGGADQSGELATGSRYDPIADRWTALLAIVDTIAARQRHAAVWADGELLIFNGQQGAADLGAAAGDNKSYTAPRSYFLFQKPRCHLTPRPRPHCDGEVLLPMRIVRRLRN